MANLLESLIKSVKVTSAWGPDIVIDRPFAPAAPGGSSVVRALKPRIEIEVQGADPLVMQPYGKPPPTKWPWLVGGAGVTVAVLGTLAVFGALSLRRRPPG